MSATGSARRLLLRVGAETGRDAAVLSESNVESIVVPAAGEGNEGKRSDGDSEKVKNAEEDEAGSDADDVAAVADAPGDRVQEPEEVNPAGEHGVVAADADAAGGAHAAVQGRVGEDEVGNEAEGKEAPLVVAAGVGGDEVADDPDPGEGDVEGDGGPGDAGEDAHGDDESRERDNPEDILGPEDLAEETIVADVVGLLDEIPGEVRGHGIVGDQANQVGDDE